MTRRLLLALILGLIAAPAVRAQTMRGFSTARQFHGETHLAVRVTYTAGILELRPGEDSDLYRMRVAYDQDRFRPLSRFSASERRVQLGLEPSSQNVLHVSSGNRPPQRAVVELSPRADLELEIELGAVDGVLELGGLRLTELQFEAGASRTTVRFSRPNPIRCTLAEFDAGAAELTIAGLANAGCDEIRFDGGIGTATLDFSGAWRSDARVVISMAMGALTLRLPRGAGVRLAMDKFLASFDPAGLIGEGTVYTSPGYERAEHRIDIDLSTAIGGVTVEWID